MGTKGKNVERRLEEIGKSFKVYINFQTQHETCAANQISIERFRKRLEDADLTNEESKTQLIKELHQQRTRNDLAAPDPSARHARRPPVCWHREDGW